MALILCFPVQVIQQSFRQPGPAGFVVGDPQNSVINAAVGQEYLTVFVPFHDLRREKSAGFQVGVVIVQEWLAGEFSLR